MGTKPLYVQIAELFTNIRESWRIDAPTEEQQRATFDAEAQLMQLVKRHLPGCRMDVYASSVGCMVLVGEAHTIKVHPAFIGVRCVVCGPNPNGERERIAATARETLERVVNGVTPGLRAALDAVPRSDGNDTLVSDGTCLDDYTEEEQLRMFRGGAL